MNHRIGCAVYPFKLSINKLLDSEQIERDLMVMVQEQLMEPDEGEELEPTDNLFEAGLDSMALMQLLLMIQDRFSVTIPASELNRKNISTVRSIALMIQKQAT